MSNVAIKLEEDFHIDFTNSRFDHHLEPQTTIYKWMFQLDDSKSLHKKWLFHQTTIYKCLFGVPGSFQFPLHLLIWWNLPNSSLMAEVVSSQGNSISDSERPIPKTSSYIQAVVSTIFLMFIPKLGVSWSNLRSIFFNWVGSTTKHHISFSDFTVDFRDFFKVFKLIWLFRTINSVVSRQGVKFTPKNGWSFKSPQGRMRTDDIIDDSISKTHFWTFHRLISEFLPDSNQGQTQKTYRMTASPSWNRQVPYSAVGEFFGQPKEESLKGCGLFWEAFTDGFLEFNRWRMSWTSCLHIFAYCWMLH